MGIITLGYCVLTTIDNLNEAINIGMDETIIHAVEDFKDSAEIQQFGRMLLGKHSINAQPEEEKDE